MAEKSKKRRAKGEGNIRQRPNGSWEARFVVGVDPGTGKDIRKSVYAKTQKEVRQKMTAAIAALDNDDYREPCKMTLGQWLDVWQREYLGAVKPRTVVDYSNNIRKHIKPALGAVKLDALLTHTIQKFYNSLVKPVDEGGKGLAPKTLKGIHLRNGTGCPLESYAELAQRWGLSKATVGRVLHKLERAGHIALLTFPGRHGTAIYLQNYLSTMFQISDVMVDKDEVAMALNIRIALPSDEPGAPEGNGSNGEIIVSNPAHEAVPQKVLQLLALQGVGCAKCTRMTYKLYALSRDSQGIGERDTLVRRFHMDVLCPSGAAVYAFEFSTSAVEPEGGFCNGKKDG